MRASNNAAWLVVDDKLLGLHLGADYVAEHEWGIAGIRKGFGIDHPSTVKGLDARKVTIVPDENLRLSDDRTRLVYSETWQYGGNHFASKELEFQRSSPDLACAWGERSFGIRVQGARYKLHLLDLFAAFLQKDIAIWLGGRLGLLANAGLNIMIARRVPEEDRKRMLAADVDNEALRQAAAATGIEAKLKAAGEKHRFFALSPRWRHENEPRRTKHKVMFWLNPYDQQNNDAGWYTVEELEAWLIGRGPVSKQFDVSRHRTKFSNKPKLKKR